MMGSTMGMDTIKSGTMGTGGDFVETSSIHNLTRPVTPVMTRQAYVPMGLQSKTNNAKTGGEMEMDLCHTLSQADNPGQRTHDAPADAHPPPRQQHEHQLHGQFGNDR